MFRVMLGSEERRRQYIYARSRMSGLSVSDVARVRTLCTKGWDESGLLRKSLIVDVRIWSWTYEKR